jgi:hypothetical protein
VSDAAATGDHAAADADDGRPDSDEAPVVEGTLRAPWKWEAMLVESAVIGGRDRWARRLAGLTADYRLRIGAARLDDPESPRIDALARDLTNLEHLRRFALPIVEALATLPGSAPWAEWLPALERLAPMVLRRPERVLTVLAELRPLAPVGPVSLDEVRDVLLDRLAALDQRPPAAFWPRLRGRHRAGARPALDVVFGRRLSGSSRRSRARIRSCLTPCAAASTPGSRGSTSVACASAGS